MTNDEIETLTRAELARVKKSYEDGSALPFGEAFVRCRRDGKGGVHTEADPALIVMALDLDDPQIRTAVGDAAWENDAFFVAVKLEVWYVSLPNDAPPEQHRAIKLAEATRMIDKREDRKEKVRVYIESEWTAIRLFEADLLRNGDAVTLAPWEEPQLSMPRPGFKRYLPERIDGKRVLKIGVR